MVGAGGIGCELLKDLILSGFGEIHIVDLDTITLSNLNRQFLFRQKDIDKSKSLTISKAVESFNYFDTKLVPHHGNIMNTKQFPIEWWGQFSYIFNALDNLEARRYVNKMSLFLKKPLMESGTTGYDGQIQPIFPYVSECFECQAKATPKTFPVCTIRSTPSQPVHCITWAKEFLFHQLFDEIESNEAVNENNLQNETDNKQEIENIMKETNEINELRTSIKNDSSSIFIKRLILKIFKIDIERALRLESLWKSRAKPTPLNYEENYETDLLGLIADEKTNDEKILDQDTKIWSVLENLYVLYRSSVNLQKRLLKGEEKFITFDKDDEDTLNFVVSSSNLRCFIFNIEIKSKFDIKQVAGNIIPAIATTNAIISGLSNLSSLKYYDGAESKKTLDHFSTTFISIRPNKYVTSASLLGPNPQCASCGLSTRGILEINQDQLSKMTLNDLIESIKSKYNYNGDLSIILGSSRLIYDYDFEDHLETKLCDIKGFVNQELLLIQDDEDELENLELFINYNSSTQLELPQLTLRQKKVPVTEEPQPVEPVAADNQPIYIEDEDSLIRDAEEIELDEQPSLKKRKTQKPIEV